MKFVITLVVLAIIALLGVTYFEPYVAESGSTPSVDVDVSGGEMPDVNVKTPEVDVQTDTATVGVPTDMDVTTETREVEVPTGVDVDTDEAAFEVPTDIEVDIPEDVEGEELVK